MLSRSQSLCGRVALMRLAVLIVLCSVGTFAAAQDQHAPKWELFGGYSYLYPDAGVHGMLPGGLLPAGSRLESNPRGAGASITYDFNRWFGLTLDSSIDWGSGEAGVPKRIDDAAFSNLSFGPKVTFRHRRVSPFIEVLVGDHRLMPDAFHDIDKLGFMFGGGLDVTVSRHIALRLFRADYVTSSYRYGPPASTPSTDLTGVRLQAGLVFMWGGNRTVTPPSAACSVHPSEVFAGEPVTATSSGSNFNPKRKVTYNWSGSGVKLHDTGDSILVDTTALQAGAYQVTASLSDGSQEGVASCTARFTVKEARPPVISCSSEPASVVIGGTSTITSVASSPDGRILSYSYSTSVGNITGSNSTATLNTSGAQPGGITVTCNASDDSDVWERRRWRLQVHRG